MVTRLALPWLVFAGVAHADPAKRTPAISPPTGMVDLLRYEGTEVSVSSTVANPKIPPC